VNLLRENVHENSWSDNSEIIARIAASMKHKETQKRSGRFDETGGDNRRGEIIPR
jgi:hypothetical protein